LIGVLLIVNMEHQCVLFYFLPIPLTDMVTLYTRNLNIFFSTDMRTLTLYKNIHTNSILSLYMGILEILRLSQKNNID